MPSSILSSLSEAIGNTGRNWLMQFFNTRLLGMSVVLALTLFCTVSYLSAVSGDCIESRAVFMSCFRVSRQFLLCLRVALPDKSMFGFLLVLLRLRLRFSTSSLISSIGEF